jgi:hypothetical protein
LKSRRFPAPWTVEDTGAAFVVKDGSGQKLGYFYYEEEPGRRTTAKMRGFLPSSFSFVNAALTPYRAISTAAST